MRTFVVALGAALIFGASAAAVDAMPVGDGSSYATKTQHVEKTEVIVKKTIVRPARRVCTTRVGPLGRVTKVCR